MSYLGDKSEETKHNSGYQVLEERRWELLCNVQFPRVMMKKFWKQKVLMAAQHWKDSS